MIAAFLATRLGRIVAQIGAVVLAVLTFGAWQRRQGVKAERAKQATAQAKADQQAHERMNHADTGAGATDDERIERLRDFAARHGNGSAKAGGR